jgi:magnesium transporter
MLYQYCREADRLVSHPGGEAAALTQPVWIDLLNPTREEEQLVEKMLGVSLPTRGEMLEIEVSARLYQENGAEFMTVTVVNALESQEPSLTPLTFVLKDQTLVTVRFTDPQIFTAFVARAQKTNEVACSTGVQVMLGLLEALSDRMADALERVAVEVDQISREIFRRKPSSAAAVQSRDLEGMIEQIGRNGDLLTKLRESLITTHRMLTYHPSANQEEKTNKDTRDKIKVQYRDIVGLMDQATFLSGKINFLLDATLGLINLQQNQIIKIVSVVAVVFLPPTLIASIYGMNFAYMPELKWLVGYPSAIVLMIISAVFPYWYFKRRGWL